MNKVFKEMNDLSKKRESLTKSFNKKYKVEKYYIKHIRPSGEIVFYNSEHYDVEALIVSYSENYGWAFDHIKSTYIKFKLLKSIMDNLEEFFADSDSE